MAAFTWYGNQSEAEAHRFGALAVIFPLLERMNVIGIINQHCPADPQAEDDYGTTLSLLMAARLYSPMALSNVAQWAQESAADLLWGIPPEKLNDDRLGRALDAFFQQRHSILAHLALHVAREFDVPLQEVHYDPTHLLFTGAYENAQPREGVMDRDGQEPAEASPTNSPDPDPDEPPHDTVRSDHGLAAAHITKGRATDDAPKGALMVHAGVCTIVDEFGPLPFFGHTVDGNQNGRTAVDEQLGLLRKHLPLQRMTLFSDRGTFSVGHRLRLQDSDSYAVCSAPWGEFRELFETHRETLTWRTARDLSLKQRRRDTGSELPQEHSELAVLRHTLADDDRGRPTPCRLIFVFSTADQKVVRQQRQEQIDRIRQGLEKTQRNVARGGPYSDEPAVAKRLSRLLDGQGAAQYFTWNMVPLTKRELNQLPPPDRGCRQPTHRLEFTFDAEAVQAAEQDDGYSVLVMTVPLSQGSADVLFTKFKQQNYSEQVKRNFEGPLAVRPVFLHTPERVEALVFLMLAVLMLYHLLQRLYRQSVPPGASVKEQRTTAATILKAFSSYCVLIHRRRLGREVPATRLTPRQRAILQQLGFSTPAQILSQHLPRPPT